MASLLTGKRCVNRTWLGSRYAGCGPILGQKKKKIKINGGWNGVEKVTECGEVGGLCDC